MHLRDVIIVGAGPAGLSAAVAARRANLDYQLLEKGVLVNTLFHYPLHMVFFTTAERLELGGLPFVSPYDKPTRLEALRYYRRVAEQYELEISLGERVTSIRHEGGAPGEPDAFAVEALSDRGIRRVLHSRFVVIATGCYDIPNQLCVPGEELPHVSHYYSEAHPFYRKDVVIVGGKNSAADAALDLWRAGARVTLVYRREHLSDSIKYWIRPDIENRIREGAIAARFEARVIEIRPTNVLIERHGLREDLLADAVFLLTGHRNDTTLLTGAGVQFDTATGAPTCDPETYETNVSGLFVAGAVIAGSRSGQIFIENGRFHGERVIAAIVRRLAHH
jgi:thioredoxin reductase (NADPH)